MSKKDKIFEEFVLKSQVMIVDKSSASRRRMAKTMNDYGVKMNSIKMFTRFEEAIQDIEAGDLPNVIFSDFLIGGGSGFDLFREIRDRVDDAKKSIFILITSNSGQSAVAQAAEEDVDAFIIKPFSIDSFHENFRAAVLNKISPSKYVLKVEEGKELLFASKVDEAIDVLEAACKLHSHPTLALFYLGQAKELKKMMDDAEGDYREGVNFNKIHYKCQVALFEMMMEKKAFEDAYEIVKLLAKYFPANPDRFTTVVRLCIMTKNYDDMEYYYEVFKELEVRSDEVISHISAGLYVTGKYYLTNSDKELGLKSLKDMAVSCNGITRFLRAGVETMVSHDLYEEADEFLGRFVAGTMESDDYMIVKFLVKTKDMKPSEIISEARELYNRGVRNYTCMYLLIEALINDRHVDNAREFFKESVEIWPDKSDALNKLFLKSNLGELKEAG